MELIKNNPYRILGVFSNASLKEITANKTKLDRYTSVGKSVTFDAALEGLLSPINRKAEDVEKAFSELSLPQDKLKYSLFWFVKDTNFDEMALGYLKAGNTDKAIELFGKRESWSGLLNTAVLSMVQGNFGEAIKCLTKVIHTLDYRTALVNAVCGDTYQIEELDLARVFVDGMRTMMPINELYALFSANGYDTSDADYLKGNMIEEPREKLQAEIVKAKAANEDGVEIFEAGATLQHNALPLLEQLEELLGGSNLEYKLLATRHTASCNTVRQLSSPAARPLWKLLCCGYHKWFAIT